MRRLPTGILVVTLAVAAFLATGPGLQAQGLSAKLDPTGMIHLMSGDVELAALELNAHGPQWKHASQADATAQVSDLPNQAGKRFVGTLPVPDSGGALAFTETVQALALGLRVEYEVGVTQAMTLDGLQVSVNLPVARYGGKTLIVTRLEEDPQPLTLPAEQTPGVGQLWSGQGSKLELDRGTDQALTIDLQGPADVLVQDLRQWQQPLFEIRFPAIMEDPARAVTPADKFHLLLTLTLAAPAKLVGP
jgi:hypothetical protein